MISFWENKNLLHFDVLIIGSGICGLSTACSIKEKNKNLKVAIIERGILPSGASTKNAGFACIGNPTEDLSDLDLMGEKALIELVHKRHQGLQILRNRLGDKNIDFKEFGGYELFDKTERFEECAESVDYFNKLMKSYTGIKNTYTINHKKIDTFQFKQIKGLIFNKKEGQIDTGKMMQNLMQFASSIGIIILNSVTVNHIKDLKVEVKLQTSIGMLATKRVVVATNGFANQLLKLKDVMPARAQVLVTKPIENLKIKGTFHYDEGYY